MDTPFELTCDALGSDQRLVAFRGQEALSTAFCLRVFVSVPLSAVPAHGDVVGQAACLLVAGSDRDAAPQPTHGLVAALRVLDETGERALLELEVRPELWFLSLSKHSRVFTEKKVPEIIAAVLDGAGLSDYELRLDASYDPREHISQYEESDFDFVSRLMEHDGIYYFFEHAENGHKLVVTDHKSSHVATRGSAVRYHPTPGGDLGADLFESFRERRRMTSAREKMTDYDYAHPTLDVSGEASLESRSGAAAVEHGPGAATPDRAQALADLRAERALAHATTYRGHGQVYHLRAGGLFDVEGHPRDAVNARYLCTALEYRANLRAKGPELARAVGIPADTVYEAHVAAIKADVQYRPLPATPRTRVANLERGTVDGAADSDYAQLDADGRYRVKLAFDESDSRGDRASVRVRMMQPHAGNPEGWHLPLRKETEVLVAFVNGDPDRPVIAGAVPNAETPSVVTSQNHTRNIFHSGGDNHVEIEDDDGKQWIDVRSPTKDSRMHLGKPHDDDSHHVVLHTDADCRFTIGGNQDIRVGGKLTEKVTGTVTETYNTSQTSHVVGDQTTTVVGDVTENYDTGHKTTVSAAVTEIYVAAQKTDVTGGDRFELYDSNQSTLVVGGATHTYDLHDMSVLGAPSTQTTAGNVSQTVAGAVTLTSDAAVNQLFGPTTYMLPTTEWKANGSYIFTTPSVNELGSVHRDTTGNCNRVTVPTTSSWKISIGLVSPLKFEFMGAYAGATAAKLEDALIVGSAIGVNFSAEKAVKTTTNGAKIELRTIKKHGV